MLWCPWLQTPPAEPAASLSTTSSVASDDDWDRLADPERSASQQVLSRACVALAMPVIAHTRACAVLLSTCICEGPFGAAFDDSIARVSALSACFDVTVRDPHCSEPAVQRSDLNCRCATVASSTAVKPATASRGSSNSPLGAGTVHLRGCVGRPRRARARGPCALEPVPALTLGAHATRPRASAQSDRHPLQSRRPALQHGSWLLRHVHRATACCKQDFRCSALHLGVCTSMLRLYTTDSAGVTPALRISIFLPAIARVVQGAC